VYGKQIEHDRKETDEFLRLSISPLPLAETITFEHDAVASERRSVWEQFTAGGERLVFEAGLK